MDKIKENSLRPDNHPDALPKTWSRLSSWVDKQGECLGVLTFTNQQNTVTKLSVYANKPVLFVSGPPGGGKSFAIKNMSDKWTKNNRKVIYITYAGRDDDFFDSKNERFYSIDLYEMTCGPSLKEAYLQTILESIEHAPTVKGDIVIVDELHRMIISAKKKYPDFIEELIVTAKKKGVILCLLSQSNDALDLKLVQQNMAAYLSFGMGSNNMVPKFLTNLLNSKSLKQLPSQEHLHSTMLVDYSLEYIGLELTFDNATTNYLNSMRKALGLSKYK